MTAENSIEVKNIKKAFKVFYDKGHSLKERVLFKKRNKYELRQVLDGISFDIKKGESVGLIGSNGCGKSTTLKMLTKIMYPDSGTIEMSGRVSSLLELGAGFHPDMSGRENIYTNASIFGLTRKEIDERIKQIIEFSELEPFMDNPVRTYSSGMYMRLAFSVAINVDADILLIDEILAVGDANFQAKCFDKLREIKRNGTTIVIVSHSLGQIEQICDRSIWIDAGKIRKVDVPRKVHPEYLDFIMDKSAPIVVEEEPVQQLEEVKNEKILGTGELGNKFVEIVEALVLDSKTHLPKDRFKVGEDIELSMTYNRNNKDIENSEFGIHIYRNDGVDCYGTNTIIDKMESIPISDSGVVKIFLYDVLLLEGAYTIDVAVHDRFGQTYHHIYSAIRFEMRGRVQEVGVTSIKHDWIF